ncbi:MAG: VTT domain-containing protein [Patescibacteria group bacterium]
MIIQYILAYKYLIILPFSVIEGPFLAVICGFLVTIKILNPWIVLPILIAGDIIGDTLLYFAGRMGKRVLRFFMVKEENLEEAKKYFADNHKKALIMSKLIHGLGFTGLLAAGAVHVPYKKYFIVCATVTVVQSVILLILGILFAGAYIQIAKYLDYYTATVSAIFAVLTIWWLIKRYNKNIIKIKA